MFQTFKTFHDPVLEGMLGEAELFVSELPWKKRPAFLATMMGGPCEDARSIVPRWLSFLGQSGTGKTFLSQLIFEQAARVTALKASALVLSPIRKFFWPRLLSRLRDGEYWLVRELADCNFVFLDELSLEHDPSGFGADKLCEILSCRVGKWTLLTSNLSMEKLGDVDGRISSRLRRGGSVVVEVETVDFNLRAK